MFVVFGSTFFVFTFADERSCFFSPITLDARMRRSRIVRPLSAERFETKNPIFRVIAIRKTRVYFPTTLTIANDTFSATIFGFSVRLNVQDVAAGGRS